MQTFNLSVNVKSDGRSVNTDSVNNRPIDGYYTRVQSDEHMGDFIVTVRNNTGEEGSFRIDFRNKPFPYLHHWNFDTSEEPFLILFTGNLSSRID